MSRPRRFLASNTPAHLVQRAVDRQTIFEQPADFGAFLDLLGEAGRRYDVQLLGYCVMPNHWHLLAQSPQPLSISRYMQWLTGTHALKHRISNDTVGLGHVYQGRFWSEPTLTEKYFYNVLRYVERNAARAGLVSRAEDWPWSSAWERKTGERHLLATLPVSLPFDWFDLLNSSTVSPPTRGNSSDLTSR
jgi:putative transposase